MSEQVELTVLHVKTDHKTIFKVIKLVKFQEIATNAMTDDAVLHLEKKPSFERVFCLKSPTGSGKTVMLAETIKKIYEALGGEVAFMWNTIGSGDLAEQSKQALYGYLQNTGIDVLLLKEALIQCPDGVMTGKIVIVNWEATNKHKKDEKDESGNLIPINRAMKSGDTISFPEMCEKTRALVPIVSIIDESHAHAGSTKSLDIRKNIIAPTYTILASATPDDEGEQSHKITNRMVSDAGLTKHSIIAEEFDNHRDGIVKAAEKLIILIEIAKLCGAIYFPKMLIFAANADKQGKNGDVEEMLAILEEKYGWTEKSGEIKLWFDGAKNTEACKQNLNTTKVIITKEAVGTGVNIPSIQIEVFLRPSKVGKVRTQKLGRGMRTAEAKHYGNELDTLYVYAYKGFRDDLDWRDADTIKELSKSKIEVRVCFKDSVSKFPVITGYYKDKESSFVHSSDEDFEEVFYPAFKDLLDKHVDQIDLSIEHELLLDKFNIDLDLEKVVNTVDQTNKKSDETDVGIRYRNTMRTKLGHLWDRRACIEKVVRDSLDLDNKRKDWQTIILNNLVLILRLKNEAIKSCQDKQPPAVEGSFEYKVPFCYYFNEMADDTHKDGKFLREQYLTDHKERQSDLERNFEKHINSHPKIEHWDRNYDRRPKESYSVVYTGDDGKRHNFYPDNVIKLIDGRILIVDSKGGDQNKNAKRDALVLALKGTDIVGGIVSARPDGHFYIDRGDGIEISFDDLLNSKQ